MAADIPNWLTKEFIAKTLQHGKDSTVTIQEFKVDMAVPKGNNFVCNVYRVSVEFTNSNNEKFLQKTSLIIKEPIYGPMYDSVLKTAIEIEVRFYKVLAPKFNVIFGGEEDEVLPKSYYSFENNVIILEDLKPKGYVTVDRNYRFDYDHCVAALKALAKFHSGGKIAIDEEPNMIESFTVKWDTDKMKKNLGGLYMTNFKNLADESKNHPDLSKYSDWLYENYETGLDKAFKLMDPKENEFNVIIHGDYGFHNMLIKYADDKTTKVLPIDFQGCRYSSPVIDFFTFIELSVEEDIWENKFDQLVQLYVTELNYNLERYGKGSRLEESEFRRYIDERSYLRVFYTVGLLAVGIGMTDESEIFQLNDFSEDKISESDTNPFKSYVKNKKFIKVITKRLNEFEKMGLIKIKKN